MAAPDSTVWSGIVNSRYKLGLYIAISSTNTQSTVTIQAWLWSRWSLSDNTNVLYFDNNATTATTQVATNIKLSHPTDDDWSTRNQTLLGTKTYTYDRTTSNQTINCACKITKIGTYSDTVSVSTSYTIPVLDSYTIYYIANGGTGAPSAQVKYYGINVTISSVLPTRNGYSFQGWSTSSSGSTVDYRPGNAFGLNANTNLYAVWKANTYTVSYNANGGSGAPSSQTKTHDVTLTLSSTIPTRPNYNFVGWSTSPNANSASYSAGGSYTSNASITLYAVWQLGYSLPRITNLSVIRCTSNGTASETGTYAKVSFSWATDKTVSSITVNANSVTTTLSASGTSGTSSAVIGSGNLSTEKTYSVLVTVSDSSGSSSRTVTLPGTKYSIDFLSGGKGVAILKPAEREGFDVGSDMYVNGVKVEGNTLQRKGNNTINNTTDDTPANWAAQGTSFHWYDTEGCLNDQPAKYGNLINIVSWSDVAQLWMMWSRLFFRTGSADSWMSQSWIEILSSMNIGEYALKRDGGGDINGYIYVSYPDYNHFVAQVPENTTSNEANYSWANKDGTVIANIGTRNTNTDSPYLAIWDSKRGGVPWSITLGGDINHNANTTLHAYLVAKNTVNTIGHFRLHTEWIGMYPSTTDAQNQTNRRGWMGFNGTSNFTISNESGGSNTTNVAWTVYSDKRMKKNIEDIPDTFVAVWKELSPKVFKWNGLNSTNQDYHFGLIAQDVIAAFEKYDLDYTEYGFVNSFTLPDDDTEYFGIAYDEYHMLTSLVVKKQQEKIDSLEERIKRLEDLILGQEE